MVEAIRTFAEWDWRRRTVFTLAELRKIFAQETEKSLSEGLRRLVHEKVLTRAGAGVYVYELSSRFRPHLLEDIACAIRNGEYNYISLECALSEWGAITQVPQCYLTVMTTGRKGSFTSRWGTVEFTHTERPASDIIANTLVRDRPLRIATGPAAMRDLRRVGRNLHLVDMEDYEEVLEHHRKVGLPV